MLNTLTHNDSAYRLLETIGFVEAAELNKLVKGLFDAMANGRKIEAIKAYRALTGEGLKPSKDAVETVMVAPVTKPAECNDYGYGHYVFRRRPNTELNEFCDAWDCVESDSTLAYARERAKDAIDNYSDGETVYVMKVVARSVTTTTMKDV